MPPDPVDPPASPDRRKLLLAGGYVAANVAALAKLGRRGGPRQDSRVRTSGSPEDPRGSATDGTTAPPRPRAPALDDAPPQPAGDHRYAVVLRGGRVMDPDTRYDQVADVGIDGNSITAISAEPLQGAQVIDVRGKVVAPGFIDLLSYEPEDKGAFFKIADGVTTNLGMHGINARSKDFIARFSGTCAVNFGGAFDDPWVRNTMFGLEVGQQASPDTIRALADECARQLDEGWIGVDMEPEYVPGTTMAEMVALAKVAKSYEVPCFFHGRFSGYRQNRPTLEEIVNVAKETGAAVHVEHIISTGGTWDMRWSLDYLQKARDSGYDVTACMYPYDFWATYLGSTRFGPGWQERFRIGYGDLQVAGTDARVTEATFRSYQRQNKLVAAYAIPEQDVRTCLQDPTVMIGSDAILTDGNDHPRATGCFSRTLGRYVRETGTISLMDALRKMTILPANRLERRVPALRRKGRLQRGADADITVFDPATVLDRSTVANPAQASQGIDYVLIGGTVVKTPAGVDESKQVGQPITGSF
ncbi:MAG: amidohydrolase family protein [Actinobacteria bacterium]|nr:amidohydrolase family protein [Actinomycetota bacterium]